MRIGWTVLRIACLGKKDVPDHALAFVIEGMGYATNPEDNIISYFYRCWLFSTFYENGFRGFARWWIDVIVMHAPGYY